jgi:hypothetical protein
LISLSLTAIARSAASTRPGKRPRIEQVGERLRLGDVVHRDELEVGSGFVGGPEQIAADAAEPVDPNPD